MARRRPGPVRALRPADRPRRRRRARGAGVAPDRVSGRRTGDGAGGALRPARADVQAALQGGDGLYADRLPADPSH